MKPEQPTTKISIFIFSYKMIICR